MKKRKPRWNKKRCMFVAALFAAVLIIIILLFIFIKSFFSTDKESKESSAVAYQGVTVEDQPEEQGEALQEEASEISQEPTVPIAAEVGKMDDEEDPQGAESMNEEGGGAQAQMDAVVKGASEKGDFSFGVDVAKWQGTIDWKQAAQAGVEFAIIRVGYRTQKTGVIMEDPLARYNLQQAADAGLKLGAYFFSTALTQEEAREEADWVISFIAQYPITYPVAYNCEGFQQADSRQYGMDKSKRSDCAVAFLDRVTEKGYQPMFYASKNEMENSTQWDMDKLETRYKIWVSQYPDAPYPQTPVSSYSRSHDMWQHTSQGSVPGIGKGVDMNVAYFSYGQTAEAVDQTPYEFVEADPEALLQMQEVNEEVTAKIVTNLRSVPSTADEATIIGKIKNGENVLRTGISASGWSRLEYNGEKVYAVSSYLTTELGYKPPENAAQDSKSPVYQPVNEAVTAKNITNLRSVASTSSEDTIVAALQHGETITRTGIGSNGWSQVDYNGQTLYAISSYLTVDMGYQQTAPDTSVYTQVSQQVTPKIECNLRTEPSTANDSTISATIRNGDIVTRVAINENTGWSKVEYNGQTLFAVSSYLAVVE